MPRPKLVPLEDGGKRPVVRGWASPTYENPNTFEGNVGLRADNIVIVDADNDQAAAMWTDMAGTETPFVVKSRKGYHFYYRLPEGAKLGPSVNEELKLDIRSGPGSFAVIPPSVVDGHTYTWQGERWNFDPAALPLAPMEAVARIRPQRSEPTDSDEGWDRIPDGRRNVTLTAIAGAMRRQGAGAEAIAATIATINANRCDPPLDHEEVVAIVRSVLRYEPDPDEGDSDIQILLDDDEDPIAERPTIVWSGDLDMPPPPRWLMFPYLPEARLVLVDGNEGIGKGMFATWIATNIAAGKFDAPPAPVLWGSTEDDPAEDILRRLLAAGHDPTTDQGIGFLNADALNWRFPGDLKPVVEAIRTTGAKCLILDPGRSFLGPPNGMSMAEFSYNNEAALRPGLEALNLLARKLGVLVIFIHHWNKNLSANIRVRSGGSAAFAQTVRHRVTLDYMDGQHALAVEKSNLTQRENTVRSYKLEEVDELKTAKFVLGDPLPVLDLDAWERMEKGDDDPATPEDRFSVKMFHLAGMAETLPIGAPFWTREQLRDEFHFTATEAKRLLKEYRDAGYIAGTDHNRPVWQGFNPVDVKQQRFLQARYDVLEAARSDLELGDAFWNRGELRERFNLSDEDARKVLQALRDDDIIGAGPNNRQIVWRGQ